MLQILRAPPSARPAVVSKSTGREAEYLCFGPDGVAAWVKDPASATAFASMKEAARMALRLPAATRAFGLPLPGDLESLEPQRLH